MIDNEYGFCNNVVSLNGFLNRPMKEQVVDITLRLTCVIQEAEEGGYFATCPQLPGLFTQGETFEEVRDMFEDAVDSYMKYLAQMNQPIPSEALSPSEPIVQPVQVRVPRSLCPA